MQDVDQETMAPATKTGDGSIETPPSHSGEAVSVSRKVPRHLPGAPLGGFHFSGSHLGGVYSYNGIPFFSDEGEKWIQTRAGSASTFRTLSATKLPWQQRKQRQLSAVPLDDDLELPDRSTVGAYFSVFCNSALKLVFPIIDVDSFESTISQAYDTRQNSQLLDVISAKACVLSFMSIVVLMQGKLEPYPTVDSEQCAAQARRLIPDIMLEANCASLQVCTMQVRYCY